MNQNQKEPIVLTSAGPIDDCGRKYNPIYFVIAAIAFVTCLIGEKSFGSGVSGALLGLGIGWLIKHCICDSKAGYFSDILFAVDRQVPYGTLTTKLISVLVPLGMAVENETDNSICIIFHGINYNVTYQSDTSFSVIWSVNFINEILGMNGIRRYRKISRDTGIIAYHIQQICSESNLQ